MKKHIVINIDKLVVSDLNFKYCKNRVDLQKQVAKELLKAINL